MARPQSVGGGRPHRVSTALSRSEKEAFDRLRGGLTPADYLRLLINRAASSSTPPRKPPIDPTIGWVGGHSPSNPG